MKFPNSLILAFVNKSLMTALFFSFIAPTYFTNWVKRESCNMKSESIVIEVDFVIGWSGKEDSVLKNNCLSNFYSTLSYFNFLSMPSWCKALQFGICTVGPFQFDERLGSCTTCKCGYCRRLSSSIRSIGYRYQ